MIQTRRGLVSLVEAARDRALARRRIEDWHIDTQGWDPALASVCRQAAAAIAGEVCRLCLGGQFKWAVNVAYPYDLFIPEELWEAVSALDGCPAWQEFCDAVALAERLDSFLTVLERDPHTHPLARDCRHDLELLCVLADWCDDHGRPAAAAEARHLHGLAESGVREGGRG